MGTLRVPRLHQVRLSHNSHSLGLLCLPADSLYTCSLPSVKLLLVFASTVTSGFSLLEIHDQDFHSLLDMYVFPNGPPLRRREGSVFLSSRCLCCTVVSARVYTRCYGVKVTMHSLHSLSPHINTRHTDNFCQYTLVQQIMSSIISPLRNCS
jgi:hypothetical protein